ncbi:pollen-specific leucine-rich repeat extensin-like protein 4 [Iris pallida]|uniref:Pollen-specific leucine-rich repeat extensin-like protein 4 n=1 Tax=Iris pallida TaxID=29817 RepID=A0AAX6GNZ7_IRIPA|nr:pollen-specific leucine-rich repeat extensin-like protein 4 [Iris pallida]
MGAVSESGRKAEESPVEAVGDGQTRRRRRKENDRRARSAHHGRGSGRCCRWKTQARTLAPGGTGVEGFVGQSLLVSVPCATLPWKCRGRRPLGRCGGAGAAPPAKSGECSALAWRTGRRPATRVLDRWGRCRCGQARGSGHRCCSMQKWDGDYSLIGGEKGLDLSIVFGDGDGVATVMMLERARWLGWR